MATIRNAAPRPILQGANDQSGRTPVLESEQIPTHLPHTFLFTERGPTLPQLVVGDKRTQTFGSKSFDEKGPYTQHQTILSNVVNDEGNYQMLQRLVPPAANPPAAIRLSADVMKRNEPVYERDVDGKYRQGNDGQRIETGETVEKTVVRWVLDPILDPENDGRKIPASDPRSSTGGQDRLVNPDFGQGASRVGTLSNSTGDESTIYPIMDIEVQDFGSYGNRLGFKLSAPTTDSDIPVDAEVIEDQMAYLFRLAFVERDARSSTAKTLETILGEKYVDFSFRDGVISEATNTEYFIDDAVIPAYEQEASAGNEAIRSPIGRIHVYENYLDELLTNCHTTEYNAGEINSDSEYRWLMNPFTGVDYNNRPYYGVRVLGPTDDGILLNGSAIHYFQGGYDGVMNFDTFDAAVAYQVSNYGDLEAKTLDDAVYPQSVIYDSGFTMETKKSLYVPMGRRKDMYVVTSTQDVSKPQNTPAEESSAAIALRTAARMYPESVVFGTACCRALVVSASGNMLQSSYKGLLPLTIELASKSAAYMGSGTGSWKTDLAMDEPPNNRVQMFKNVNAEWRPENARINDWDNGMIWAQSYDRRSLFWPGMQTVYDDDSSVANAYPTMAAIVELEKVAQRVWRDLTGISSLTADQFVERSNRLIREATAGRFDGRFNIQPNTEITTNDTQRGYSWHCNIVIQAANMRTVGVFTIVPQRIDG